MINYSDVLIEFHRQILRWVDNGCPEHPVFKSNMGLCSNACYWAAANGFSHSRLDSELDAMFKNAGLNNAYPFYMRPKSDSIGDYTDDEFEFARRQYRNERPDGALYHNERRLNWIHGQAAHLKSTEIGCAY